MECNQPHQTPSPVWMFPGLASSRIVTLPPLRHRLPSSLVPRSSVQAAPRPPAPRPPPPPRPPARAPPSPGPAPLASRAAGQRVVLTGSLVEIFDLIFVL